MLSMGQPNGEPRKRSDLGHNCLWMIWACSFYMTSTCNHDQWCFLLLLLSCVKPSKRQFCHKLHLWVWTSWTIILTKIYSEAETFWNARLKWWFSDPERTHGWLLELWCSDNFVCISISRLVCVRARFRIVVEMVVRKQASNTRCINYCMQQLLC